MQQTRPHGLEPGEVGGELGCRRLGRLGLQRAQLDAVLLLGLGAAIEQPAIERARGGAVVLVVAGDAVEVLLVAVLLPGLPAAQRADRAAQLGVALEADDRLERLEAVALDAGPDRLPADAVEVDEHLAAQQLVELVLAYRVARDEPLERRRLVGVEVEDVQVGVLVEAMR